MWDLKLYRLYSNDRHIPAPRTAFCSRKRSTKREKLLILSIELHYQRIATHVYIRTYIYTGGLSPGSSQDCPHTHAHTLRRARARGPGRSRAPAGRPARGLGIRNETAAVRCMHSACVQKYCAVIKIFPDSVCVYITNGTVIKKVVHITTSMKHCDEVHCLGPSVCPVLGSSDSDRGCC